MPLPLTSLSPQLKIVRATLHGDWVRRWERNRWEGNVSCGEEIVTLILVRLTSEIIWAKSLPSTNKSLSLTFDLFPTSKTQPQFQFHFSVGTGAFIQQATGTLVDRDYKPPILAPSEIETGSVIPFANFLPNLEFAFACFAKSDVIVRRHYVWGLKPRFLEGLDYPWREILTKGRNGVVSSEAVMTPELESNGVG